MRRDQFILPLSEEIVCDLFAGGGGMSEAIEMALNRHADIALNHNPDAISMHEANHPQTEHLIADVREVCPYVATRGRPVGYLHLSPDCRDFSQAKGGQPRDRKIRALSWTAVHWGGTVRPRLVSIENVKQLISWGPMIAKRDKESGRVVKLDGTIAAKGEYVPLREQFLIPDPKRKGDTWKRFVNILRSLGYVVEWRVSRACAQGAGTWRERLFMIARRDGQPIVWPDDTHSVDGADGKIRFKPAADCIDFSLPAKSIFGRKKDLAKATLRRVAAGIEREILNSADPFIVPTAGAGEIASRHEQPLASPVLLQVGYGERKGQAPRVLRLDQPLGTTVAGGVKHALATAYLAQMNGGFNDLRGVPGHDLRRPMSSITNRGSQQQVVCANLVHLRTHCDARSLREPIRTISAGGQHHALVECVLSPEDHAGALRVATFLKEHGVRLPARIDTSSNSVNDGDFATVLINGITYAIVDVRLRCLEPFELFAAQGFPPDYIIDRGHDGRVFTKAKQIHMCGNSVSPPWAAAFVRANLPELILPDTLAPTRRRERPVQAQPGSRKPLLDRVAA